MVSSEARSGEDQVSILNIVDRRKRPYRFQKINAIVEPTRHDNCKKPD